MIQVFRIKPELLEQARNDLKSKGKSFNNGNLFESYVGLHFSEFKAVGRDNTSGHDVQIISEFTLKGYADLNAQATEKSGTFKNGFIECKVNFKNPANWSNGKKEFTENIQRATFNYLNHCKKNGVQLYAVCFNPNYFFIATYRTMFKYMANCHGFGRKSKAQGGEKKHRIAPNSKYENCKKVKNGDYISLRKLIKNNSIQ